MTDDGCCNIHLSTVIDGAGCPQCRTEFSKPFHSEIAQLRTDLTAARAEIERLRDTEQRSYELGLKHGSGDTQSIIGGLKVEIESLRRERDKLDSDGEDLSNILARVQTERDGWREQCESVRRIQIDGDTRNSALLVERDAARSRISTLTAALLGVAPRKEGNRPAGEPCWCVDVDDVMDPHDGCCIAARAVLAEGKEEG